MALDPATLKARIDLRIYELKALAAETAASWAQACEREKSRSSRGLPPLPRDGDANEVRAKTGAGVRRFRTIDQHHV